MDFDFAVIGGGSAGYAAARTAADLGLKTAVIEGGQDIGGLCILRGCMPSKAIIESANRFITLRRAPEFGLRAEYIGFDGGEIIARKRRLITEFADYRRMQLESGKFAFIRGRASFDDPHTIRVEGTNGSVRRLTARTALVATGSVISSPDLPGLAETGFLTSDDALDLEQIPRSVIVLGGGATALELGHYFAGLGVQTTIIQRSAHVLKGSDSDVAEAIEAAFRHRGVALFTQTKLVRFENAPLGKRVVFEHEGVEKSVESEQILNALGRNAATAGLSLERAGVAVEDGKVKVDSSMQTTRPHIFAAGDVCSSIEIVHLAIHQGEVAARNAASLLSDGPSAPLECTDHRLMLFAVFTEPQVAIVGAGEDELREKGVAFRSAKHPFSDHGKSLVIGEPEGFVKLIAHAATGEILGGACVGPNASDLIHEIVVAMAFRATAARFAAIPHYHPTLSEIWTYPAEELAR